MSERQEKSPLIFIAEDDHSISQVLELILQDEGYRTEKEGNGLYVAKRISETKPDLLLLDYTLPGLKADEVLDELRSTNPLIAKLLPVILLTATANGEETAKKLQTDAFVNKPFELDDLLHVISTLLTNSSRL